MSSFPTPPQAPASGSSAYAPPSQWPTTIGAISIVYGALGGILALYGLVSSVLLGAGSAPGVPQGFEVPSEVKAFSVLDAFFGLLFAAMLILGGIAVIRRRGGGVKLLRSYAIARLVLLVPLAVGAGWAGSVTAKAVFETIEQQSQPNQSGPEASGAGEESGMGEAVSADGMTVTSKDGNIEVVGGTVESHGQRHDGDHQLRRWPGGHHDLGRRRFLERGRHAGRIEGRREGSRLAFEEADSRGGQRRGCEDDEAVHGRVVGGKHGVLGNPGGDLADRAARGAVQRAAQGRGECLGVGPLRQAA